MTSETMHTPGPWAEDASLGGAGRIITLAKDADGDGYRIRCPGSGGAMSLTNEICQLSWRNTDEWKANAALIASAPDLLADNARLKAENERMREAAEALTQACEEEFGVCDICADEPDDEPVMSGGSSPCEITFGLIRNMRAALAAGE